MIGTLVIVAVALAALACPLVMWLGRRGIGRNSPVSESAGRENGKSLEALRARQRALEQRIARLEAEGRHPVVGPPRG